MLEELALRYSEVPEDEARLVSYSLTTLGGIIGGITYGSVAAIGRAHYFALSGLIGLCIALVTFGSIAFVVQALISGFFWVIMAAEMLALVIGGFFLARIAADRSRDAYGHGRMAALAFIPFANLWLLLTPSNNDLSANRLPSIPLLTGGLGVLSGFVMLGAGIALSSYAQIEGIRRVEEASSQGAFNVAMLDRTIAAMAAEVQTPATVDEATTLIRMESEGSELRFVYTVNPPPDFLPADMRSGLLQQNCSYDGLIGVIDAGAVIKHVYLRNDGTEIGVVEVKLETCGR